MVMKIDERGRDPLVTDRWDAGLGWIAHPEEGIQRASHALVGAEDDVWVVEPVDADGIDDQVSALGTVAGVVVLFDRHRRDADAFAERHDVAVHIPAWMDGVEPELEAPVERFDRELADTGYRLRPLLDNRFWQEGTLVGSDGTLVVPEAVGTADVYRAGGERLGVHPVLRLVPPRRALAGLSPRRVLVGHGTGVFDDADTALSSALRSARRNAPRAYAEALRSALPI